MVEARYLEMKEKAKASIDKAAAVSLTSDLWMSVNTEAYLAVTCQLVDDSSKLNTVVLLVKYFQGAQCRKYCTSQKLTHEGMGCILQSDMPCNGWAANMGACARELQLKHAICIQPC